MAFLLSCLLHSGLLLQRDGPARFLPAFAANLGEVAFNGWGHSAKLLRFRGDAFEVRRKIGIHLDDRERVRRKRVVLYALPSVTYLAKGHLAVFGINGECDDVLHSSEVLAVQLS